MRSTEGKEKATKLLGLEDHAPAWSEHSMEAARNPVARSSAGIALKAVGEKFVAIGSRKNLLTANSFPRWSYSQSDALTTSGRGPQHQIAE